MQSGVLIPLKLIFQLKCSTLLGNQLSASLRQNVALRIPKHKFTFDLLRFDFYGSD